MLYIKLRIKILTEKEEKNLKIKNSNEYQQSDIFQR
jgi:hypothetical protein